MPWSFVRKTSNPAASAATSRSPFFSPANPEERMFGNHDRGRTSGSLIDAFIDQDSHLRTSGQKVFRLFESSNGSFTSTVGNPSRKFSIVSLPLRSRNVLGYEPWPQILNEPKSLNQAPSGTSGLDSIQTRSRLRSAMLIARSRIRSIRCTGRSSQ